MSSTATTVIASSRQPHGFRLSDPPYRDHQDKLRHPEMSSAAYYRAAGYETGGPSRDSYNSMSGSRSWATGKTAQAWQGEYPSYSQNQAQQRQQQQQQFQQQVPVQVRHTVAHHTTSQATGRQTARQSTPNSTHSSHHASGTLSNGGDAQSMVMHSLQIPSRISTKGGNLADFAAQVRRGQDLVRFGQVG